MIDNAEWWGRTFIYLLCKIDEGGGDYYDEDDDDDYEYGEDEEEDDDEDEDNDDEEEEDEKVDLSKETEKLTLN